ncbi:MAG: PqqD family protein [Leptospiraceae bacterium]|nr:PqqD family protein [Leptospiraceae bacterium]
MSGSGQAVSENTRYVMGGDVSWREVDGQVVCMHLDSGEYFTFNAVAGLVWKEVLAGKDMMEIGGVLQQRYNLSAEQSRADARSFVEHLLQSGLIVPGQA